MTEIVIVNTHNMRVVKILSEGEDLMTTLKNTEKENAQDIATWKKHVDKYGSETFILYLEEAKKASFEIMTFDEYEERQRRFLLDVPPKKISLDRFYDALECLPPLKHFSGENIEFFLMSEFFTGYYTEQYIHHKKTGLCYCKIVDAYDSTTWMK